MITLEEFRDEVMEWANNEKPREWRYGQAVFNYIDEKYKVARKVQFIDEVDCFYDDDQIDKFIACCWNKLNSDNEQK